MIEQSYRKCFALIAVLLLVSVPTLSTSQVASAASTQTGVILPLYTYPGSMWDTVIQTKNAHPSVPILAVINPNNGPGGSFDSNYLAGVQKLQAAGVFVMGYVYTSYGSRSTSSITTDINNYKNWYHPNGIAFDEMSNVPGFENYYSNLSSYAKSQGFTLTVANPGTETLPSYIGTVDNMIIYENRALPPISALASWHTNYAKGNFSMIAFGVSSISQSVVTTDSNYVAYMYITDDTLPNPYDTLPSYFGNLVVYLETSSLPPPPTTQISLTVNSVDLSGTPITGMWTTIQSGSTTITTGFTPLNYTVTAGNQYIVTAANNQTAIFNHWDDGSTNPSRTITPTANTVLTAYYSTGASVTVPQAPTNLSVTAISSSQINLGWIAPSNNGGSLITGYKVERSTDGGSTWSISNTASTPYSDTGLLSSTTYTYRVSAINSIGTSSPSNTASATTLSPPPPAPTGLVATAASTTQINLSWSSSTGATGYNILRGTTTGGPYTQAGTSTTASFSDTGLTPSTPYYYVVQATSSAGPSINSLEAAATTLSVVSSPPTGLTATTISSSQIKLSWTAPSNTGGSPITGYKVERSTDGGLHWSTIKSNTGSVTTYSNTGLAQNTSYTYRVSAINSAGTSSPSNTASATTSSRNVSLIVNSVNLSGTSITGMWVELHAANGATIATGFTPKTFQVTSGTQYTVYVANYKTTIFNHWDNGSTNPGRTITPTTSTTLTASYSTGP